MDSPVPTEMKVGFVWVGHLGTLLAHSLLRAGCAVTVTDLNKTRWA